MPSVWRSLTAFGSRRIRFSLFSCGLLHNCLSKNSLQTNAMAKNGSFDPTVFESYYNRAEAVEGLDLSGETWTRTSLLAKVRELLVDRPPLLHREFVKVADPPGKNSFKIRVMQWNVLAQALSVGDDNFVRCPPAALSWEKRRLRMLEEILVHNADVICLQEVDHYGFLMPALAAVGYRGAFCPKPDSPAMYSSETNGPDGCAMFYRQEALNIIEQEKVVLQDTSGKLTNQVAVISTLQPRTASGTMAHSFSIATTHLKAKNGWDELRHEEGIFLLRQLASRNQHALIVCGDFNADSSEPVYREFSQSELNLASAYMRLSTKSSAEPAYTTWKIRGSGDGDEIDVCRTIDYIWYSHRQLKVSALLSFPTEAAIGKNRLPSFEYPSDHFSLVSDFYFV